MKKIHIAISSNNIEKTVVDYTKRLNCQPCLVVEGEYALWRTESVNFSVRQDRKTAPGSLRHLGWEDSDAQEFTEEIDVNGIIWERFNAAKQAEEIKELWPDTEYQPDSF
ncbi:MAG: hypothetical protein EA395_13040 [Phormidium sp. GEM2.Bin31]|nr:hypothetical protein [Phormidium sp. BM_Day4_Bin.17]TVR07357.1 MAG: hypothetical protein EA395_13040 [Phormidium sp. GEM2.Bin31]UCJ13832.1 MAG: hypothetical protein JWS08_08925 [Phormidium sp. PBR-2020]